MNLDGKRAIVTGGSRGIGRAIAEAFIQKGARCLITGRDKDILERTAKEIGAHPLVADVAIEADCVRTVETAVAELGGLDILVNNAGFGYFAPLLELETSRFLDVFATNVTGAMMMGREAARLFVEQQSGAIVNISSTSGLKGGRNSTAYSSSKFALRGMTECWRDELRRDNIRVVLVNPSEVQTGFGGRDEAKDVNPKKLVAKDIADAIVGVLEIDDRGFVPELAVFATNPF